MEFAETLRRIAEGELDVDPLITGSVGIEGVPAGLRRPRRSRGPREDPGRALIPALNGLEGRAQPSDRRGSRDVPWMAWRSGIATRLPTRTDRSRSEPRMAQKYRCPVCGATHKTMPQQCRLCGHVMDGTRGPTCGQTVAAPYVEEQRQRARHLHRASPWCWRRHPGRRAGVHRAPAIAGIRSRWSSWPTRPASRPPRRLEPGDRHRGRLHRRPARWATAMTTVKDARRHRRRAGRLGGPHLGPTAGAAGASTARSSTVPRRRTPQASATTGPRGRRLSHLTPTGRGGEAHRRRTCPGSPAYSTASVKDTHSCPARTRLSGGPSCS